MSGLLAGGLFLEASSIRFSLNTNYLFITAIAIGLIWITNIFEIISLASRAFAFYYALQAFDASIVAYNKVNNTLTFLRFILFILMTVLMLMITVFGAAV